MCLFSARGRQGIRKSCNKTVSKEMLWQPASQYSLDRDIHQDSPRAELEQLISWEQMRTREGSIQKSRPYDLRRLPIMVQCPPVAKQPSPAACGSSTPLRVAIHVTHGSACRILYNATAGCGTTGTSMPPEPPKIMRTEP